VFGMRSERIAVVLFLGMALACSARAQATDAERLIAAVLGDTPVIADLQELTDGIGQRVTGSAANRRAVEWAVGRFRQAEVDVRTVGTDNFDFMMQGVPNLVALQSDANYASNYHAESDTFDKVDQYQLKLNAAIAAAVVWGFANDTARVPRHDHADIAAMVEAFGLESQMKNFAVWQGWAEGKRGRHD